MLGGLTVPALEGDFSLNAANVLSADVLLTRGALSRLAPTHDLNAPQVWAHTSAAGQILSPRLVVCFQCWAPFCRRGPRASLADTSPCTCTTLVTLGWEAGGALTG